MNYHIQIEVRHTGYYNHMKKEIKEKVDSGVRNQNRGIASFAIKIRNENFLGEMIPNINKENFADSIA